MIDRYSDKNDFPGIYRGVVRHNRDPKNRGRIKIYIPGVYPEKLDTNKLPWASPASPMFGGGGPNPETNKSLFNYETGWCSVPHVDSQVFVFFENGDINYPIYFAVAQSGKGWFSEHPNQHCFNTDNVRIRIDEDVDDKSSTCQFDSYTGEMSEVAKTSLKQFADAQTEAGHPVSFDESAVKLKNLKTRVDLKIDVADTADTAVNLCINGNVNMIVNGEWFEKHVGNRYIYHKGNTYIKQDGSTFIEETGTKDEKITGSNFFEVTEDHTQIIGGEASYMHKDKVVISNDSTENKTVKGDVSFSTLGSYSENIQNNKRSVIGGTEEIINGGDITRQYKKNLSVTVGENFNFDVGESMSVESRRGNIELKTDGEFELMKNGSITSKGFENIGTKGNIRFVSTFGNINLQCVKNDLLANLATRSTVIPWNPGFPAEAKACGLFPNFEKGASVDKSFNLATDINSEASMLATMLDADSALIFDGLPTCFPTKMILQNPNCAVENAGDLSWIPKFRSESTDWRTIDPNSTWKLPGRLIGNINIETWSGDINIKTESELGCAGNINIVATESAGTLPNYKAGTVNVKSEAEKRIFEDPRDLFFDSDFLKKNNGVISLFSHSSSESEEAFPKNTGEALAALFGKSFTINGTDYSNFYNLYGLDVVTNGNSEEITEGQLNHLEELKSSSAPVLGCSKCISDYLLAFTGIKDLAMSEIDLDSLPGGHHKYSCTKFSPIDLTVTRGPFSPLSFSYNKMNFGDAEAIDSNFIDAQFNGPNLGGLNISIDGEENRTIGGNLHHTYNKNRANGTAYVDYKYEEKVLDLALCEYATNCLTTISDLFGKLAGKVFSSGDDGVKIAEQDLEIDFGLDLMPSIPNTYKTTGFTVTKSEKVGTTYESTKTLNSGSSFEFSFDFDNLFSIFYEHMTENLYQQSMKIDKNDTYEEAITEKNLNTYKLNGSKGLYKVEGLDKDQTVTINYNKNFFKESKTTTVDSYHEETGHSNILNVYWNFDQMSQEKPELFPDVEVCTKFYEEKTLNTSFTNTCSMYEWSFFGNKYISHNNKTHWSSLNKTTDELYVIPEKCDQTFVEESDATDYASIWDTPIGCGVNVEMSESKKAEYVETPYSVLKSNDSNERLFFNKDWEAAKELTQTKNFLTNAYNACNEQTINYSGTHNKNSITYIGAINSNILTLTCDKVAEDLDDPKDLSGRLLEGNTYKIILTGEKNYENYKSEVYPDVEWTPQMLENKFELIQSEFPTNIINVENGYETMSENAVNSITVKNGGISSDNKNRMTYSNNFNQIYIDNGLNLNDATNDVILSNGDSNFNSRNTLNVANGANNVDLPDTKKAFFNNMSVTNGSMNNPVDENASISISNTLNITNGELCNTIPNTKSFVKNEFKLNNAYKNVKCQENRFEVSNGYMNADTISNVLVIENANSNTRSSTSVTNEYILSNGQNTSSMTNNFKILNNSVQGGESNGGTNTLEISVDNGHLRQTYSSANSNTFSIDTYSSGEKTENIKELKRVNVPSYYLNTDNETITNNQTITISTTNFGTNTKNSHSILVGDGRNGGNLLLYSGNISSKAQRSYSVHSDTARFESGTKLAIISKNTRVGNTNKYKGGVWAEASYATSPSISFDTSSQSLKNSVNNVTTGLPAKESSLNAIEKDANKVSTKSSSIFENLKINSIVEKVVDVELKIWEMITKYI